VPAPLPCATNTSQSRRSPALWINCAQRLGVPVAQFFTEARRTNERRMPTMKSARGHSAGRGFCRRRARPAWFRLARRARSLRRFYWSAGPQTKMTSVCLPPFPASCRADPAAWVGPRPILPVTLDASVVGQPRRHARRCCRTFSARARRASRCRGPGSAIAGSRSRAQARQSARRDR